MVKVYCRTNMDLHHGEIWPSELPARPMIGDYIRSDCIRRERFQLELIVVRVTTIRSSSDGKWYYEVEMGLPPHRFHNFTHFQNMYDYKCGRITRESYEYREELRIEKEKKEREEEERRRLAVQKLLETDTMASFSENTD